MKTVTCEPENIVVFEPHCRGMAHVPFNAAFLTTLRIAFPLARLDFYGDQEHLVYVALETRRKGLKDIQYHAVDVESILRKSYLFQVWKFRYLLEKACRPVHRVCCILSCATSSSLCSLSMTGLRHPGISCFAVFHSALAGAFGWRSRNPIYRIQDLRSAIGLSRRFGVRFVVLEDSIRRNLLVELPSYDSSFFTLDHPILGDRDMEIEAIPSWPPLKFAFLGLATGSKGFHKFVDLAHAARERGINAEFHVIGRKAKDLELHEAAYCVLASQPSNHFLDRNDYEESLKGIHFCVFPYNEDHYRFTASGALMDAICWGKPVIAPDIMLFRDIFNKYGQIGLLYRNESDLFDLIQKLCACFCVDEYRRMQANIKRVRRDRLPENLASKMRSILCS